MLNVTTPQVIRELLNIRSIDVKDFAKLCGVSSGYARMILMRHRVAPHKTHELFVEKLGLITDTELEMAQELALLRSLYHRTLIRASQNRNNNMKLRGRPFKV